MIPRDESNSTRCLFLRFLAGTTSFSSSVGLSRFEVMVVKKKCHSRDRRDHMVLHWQRRISLAAFLIASYITFTLLHFRDRNTPPSEYHRRAQILHRCRYIQTPPGPPPDFHPARRLQSDRFVPGTNPVLLRNAKIWTAARNGTEIVFGDVLLDKGLIKSVGYIPHGLLDSNIEIHDVQGAWVTPGLVDLHSHMGVEPIPNLRGSRPLCSFFSFFHDTSLGASDVNSFSTPILPWLRSIDGLNTHDDSYALAIAGGVTTAQILPGSANNIGTS